MEILNTRIHTAQGYMAINTMLLIDQNWQFVTAAVVPQPDQEAQQFYLQCRTLSLSSFYYKALSLW